VQRGRPRRPGNRGGAAVPRDQEWTAGSRARGYQGAVSERAAVLVTIAGASDAIDPFDARSAGVRWTRVAGNRTANLLPAPGRLVMSSVAWWRSTTCLTIASPSPVPPVARERLRSTR